MNIQVEPHDELNTVVYKVRSAKEKNLIVVVPDSFLPFRNSIALGLLKQYANEDKKRIAIQTEDPLIQKEATKLGILVLGSGELATTQEVPKDERKSNPSLTRVFALLLLIFVLSSYYLLYYAPVTVGIALEVLQFQDQMVIPHGFLVEHATKETASVTLTKRTPATGSKVFGTSYAQGTVILINTQNEEILLPQGTLVQTRGGIPFRTLDEVTVPPVTTEYFMDVPTGLKAGRTEVLVQAVEKGLSGNVSEGRIEEIPGFALTVRNPEALRGGTEAVFSTIQVLDRNRAKDLVLQEARVTLLELLDGKKGERILLPHTLEVFVEWLEYAEEGQEGAEAYARGLVQGVVYSFSEEDLRALIGGILSENAPAGFSFLEESLLVFGRSIEKKEKGSFVVPLSYTYKGQKGDVLPLLLGKNAEEVQSLAEELPYIREIDLRGRKKALPTNPNRIRLVAKE